MPANKSSRRKRPAKHKARQSLKERASDFSDSSDQVFEEITALSAIFQDDFKLVSEQPVAEFSIQLRPHSVDEDNVEEDVSAELVVRCLPGYPQKPPKLHVISQKGLSNEQLHQLHSLLVEQAAILAREGRVMVFNLTEVAQEFLSENRSTHSNSGACQDNANEENLTQSIPEMPSQGALITSTGEDDDWLSEDFVFFDLFESNWVENDSHWDYGFGLSHSRNNYQTLQHDRNELKQGRKSVGSEAPLADPQRLREGKGNIKPGPNNGSARPEGLHVLKEVDDEEKLASQVLKDAHSKTVSDVLQEVRRRFYKSVSQMGLAVKKSVLPNRGSIALEDSEEEDGEEVEEDEEDDGSESSSDDELPVTMIRQDAATQSIQKDLLLDNQSDTSQLVLYTSVRPDLVLAGSFLFSADSIRILFVRDGSMMDLGSSFTLHTNAQMLRLVCGARGPLPNALPALATQLEDLGILPQWVKDLVTQQPDIFDATFQRTFSQAANDFSYPLDPTIQLSLRPFWDASPDLLGEGNNSAFSNSRYLSDFEELSLLGEGGFGHVVLCENKLDGRRYAMKKIRLKVKTLSQNNKILREVATLARLQHQHVVRYYQAWIETGLGSVMERLKTGSEVTDSEGDWISSGQSKGTNVPGASKGDAGLAQTTYLYIQMEYCPRTLREVFNTYEGPVDKEGTWRMFRQIVEGLAHIHSRGIIHRDLTPNNIFFDARNDIKIGDFGLAKFANLEQPDVDPNPLASVDMPSGSVDGTGAVGTYFYTAPEIEQHWPHIDEKVDMYSLGVVLFELWYQFSTSMERYVLLNDLKLKGTLPPTWSAEFESQAELVRWLTAAQPSERPSAVQVLRSDLLPPRMQDEALNDILRTIQHAEDTTVYDQVVAAIFDDDRIKEKADQVEREGSRSKISSSHVKKVGIQEWVIESVKEVFTRHGAQPVDCTDISALDDPKLINGLAVRLVDSSGNMLQLRYETRAAFAYWIAANQVTSLKRYQIARVYRRGVGNSAPHEFLQGDFDIVGGTHALAMAEAIKVAAEVVSKFSGLELHEVRVNHRQLLNAIWAWAGVKHNERHNIAQALSIMGGTSAGSSARKAFLPHVRRQLIHKMGVAETVVDKLQTVERRLSGTADETLARMRGALPLNARTSAAIDHLSMLLGFLRVWGLEKVVKVDALMSPSEEYFDASYFQVHVQRASSGFTTRDMSQPLCFGVGGCYDRLLQRYWAPTLAYAAPSAVGVSIGVQKLISIATAERKHETSTDVLVCSRGGGGLLKERMQVVSELWAANIKAEYVCSTAPSLTEQYEYAHEHCIKWLVIITEAGLSQNDSVKVRYLEGKYEEDISREHLVKLFSEDPPLTPINLKQRAANLRLLDIY